MAKYIIPSYRYYKTNDNCHLCKHIDSKFEQLLKISNSIYLQQQIKDLERTLVNGFEVDDVLLSTHNDINNITLTLNSISPHNDDYYNYVYKYLHLPYDTYNEYNALTPDAKCVRYCKNCGARKHDIYDSLNSVNLHNLTFKSSFNPDHNHIVFSDDIYNNAYDYVLYDDNKKIANIEPNTEFYDDISGKINSKYSLGYVNNMVPDIEKLIGNDGNTYLFVSWDKNVGYNTQLYKSKQFDSLIDISKSEYAISATKQVVKKGNNIIYVFTNKDKNIIGDMSNYQYYISPMDNTISYNYIVHYYDVNNKLFKLIPNIYVINNSYLLIYWDEQSKYNVSLYQYSNNEKTLIDISQKSFTIENETYSLMQNKDKIYTLSKTDLAILEDVDNIDYYILPYDKDVKYNYTLLYRDTDINNDDKYILSYNNTITPEQYIITANKHSYIILYWKKNIGHDIRLYKNLENIIEQELLTLKQEYTLSKVNDDICLQYNNETIYNFKDNDFVDISNFENLNFYVDKININNIFQYHVAYSRMIEQHDVKFIPRHNHLKWDGLDNYKMPYNFLLYKAENDKALEFVAELLNYEYDDYDISDNKVYYYKIVYQDEIKSEIISLLTDVIYLSDNVVLPKPLNDYYFRKHKTLNEETFEVIESVSVEYSDFDGDVLFKFNEYHVPSLAYYLYDNSFWNHEQFIFNNKSTTYFLKPYVRSQQYKQYSTNNIGKYQDLYYWNYDSKISSFKYEPYEDNIVDIDFFASTRHQVIINVLLKEKHTVDSLFLVFKQVNNLKSYICNTDWEEYKVLNIPCDKALYDYQITINGLASNTYWVFGVFPTYVNDDPDIRLEYQSVLKVLPVWAETNQYITSEDFYDINKWYCEDEIWKCNSLSHMECAPLLIHYNNISEHFKLEFDYKVQSKTAEDRLHFILNHAVMLRIANTYGNWFHMEVECYNKDFLILRWELMKLFNGLDTTVMIKNITLTNYDVKDDKVDNYTRIDEIKVKNKHYYNNVIKHNDIYKFVGDKYYYLEVNLNSYFDDVEDTIKSENFDVKNGMITIGCKDVMHF